MTRERISLIFELSVIFLSFQMVLSFASAAVVWAILARISGFFHSSTELHRRDSACSWWCTGEEGEYAKIRITGSLVLVLILDFCLLFNTVHILSRRPSGFISLSYSPLSISPDLSPSCLCDIIVSIFLVLTGHLLSLHAGLVPFVLDVPSNLDTFTQFAGNLKRRR